ncbi:hypothetical protein LJR039_007481 [Pseudorhodoferax sp. LjRoot39]
MTIVTPLVTALTTTFTLTLAPVASLMLTVGALGAIVGRLAALRRLGGIGLLRTAGVGVAAVTIVAGLCAGVVRITNVPVLGLLALVDQLTVHFRGSDQEQTRLDQGRHLRLVATLSVTAVALAALVRVDIEVCGPERRARSGPASSTS